MLQHFLRRLRFANFIRGEWVYLADTDLDDEHGFNLFICGICGARFRATYIGERLIQFHFLLLMLFCFQLIFVIFFFICGAMNVYYCMCVAVRGEGASCASAVTSSVSVKTVPVQGASAVTSKSR